MPDRSFSCNISFKYFIEGKTEGKIEGSLDKDVDVSIYWMLLRKRKDNGI
jgi:hypothetical protein